jgi:acetyl-CoA decarbonylase/synthase complex subunit delta
MISSAIDSLNIKEVREAPPSLQSNIAVRWEFYTALASAAAGAEIVCVRHPESVALLKDAFASLKSKKPGV